MQPLHQNHQTPCLMPQREKMPRRTGGGAAGGRSMQGAKDHSKVVWVGNDAKGLYCPVRFGGVLSAMEVCV